MEDARTSGRARICGDMTVGEEAERVRDSRVRDGVGAGDGFVRIEVRVIVDLRVDGEGSG